MENKYWIEELYRKHKGKFILLAYRICGDMEAANDIVHEATLLILLFQEPITSLDQTGAIFYTIVKRRALKYLRNEKSHLKKCTIFTDTYIETTLDNFYNGNFEYYPYNETTNKLKLIREDYAMIIKLWSIGYTKTEIAKIMQLEKNNISQSFTYAIKNFKRVFFNQNTYHGTASLQKNKETDKIIRLVEMGMKHEDICRVFKISRTTVIHRINTRKNSPTFKLNLSEEDNQWCNTIYKQFYTPPKLNKRAAKLNEEQVKRIKLMLKERKDKKEIAKIFNIHPAQISKISTGKRWGYVAI